MQYYIRVEPNVNLFINDINPSSNKVIVFLHGWPLNNEMFEYQYNFFLQHGYRCIGIDMRGFGKSDKPIRNYTYNRIADDIRTIIEMLNLNNIILVGHSVGGAIAIRYMSRHNGYGVSKLILLAAAAPSFTRLKDFPYGLTKDEVNKYIEATYTDRPAMLQSFTDIFFNKYITNPFSHWILNLGLVAAGYSTAQILISLRDENLFTDVNNISKPTLICQGVHDKVCPIQFGETLDKLIPNSKLILYQNSGHALFWEEKDKLNNDILDFIK